MGDELPDGHHDERARLIAGLQRAVSDYGYRGTRIEHVLRYAELPRESFDGHFDSLEDALACGQDSFYRWLRAEVACDCEGEEGEWPERVRAGVGAVIARLSEASRLARAFMFEARPSLAALEARRTAIEDFASLLAEGRRRHLPCTGPPELTEEILVAGVLGLLTDMLANEEPGRIRALQPKLVEALLAPYLGPAAARRVARA